MIHQKSWQSSGNTAMLVKTPRAGIFKGTSCKLEAARKMMVEKILNVFVPFVLQHHRDTHFEDITFYVPLPSDKSDRQIFPV